MSMSSAAPIALPAARRAPRAARHHGPILAGLMLFSALIDIALLFNWSSVNHGYYQSDWLMFYQAAERLRDGGQPYVVVGEFRNPPTFLLLARASLLLGYIPSRIIWSVASTVMLLGAARLAAHAVTWRADARTQVFGAIAMLLYVPTILLIPTSGNSTAPVALSYGLAVWLFSRGRDDWGGAALCLAMLVKPQLAFLTLPLLLYKRRWRAVAGYLVTGAACTLMALIVTGRHTFVNFYNMSRVTASMADRVPLWLHDIPGLHAALLQAFPGSVLAGIVAYALGTALVAALAWYWRGPWEPASPRFGAGWAMLVLVDLLTAPYAHSDDLVLLIIPMIVLYTLWRRADEAPLPWRDTLLPTLLGLYLAPVLVVYFRQHFMVPAMLAALLVLWRATAREPGSLRPGRNCS